MSNKIYDMITDRILDLMNKGIIPWQKPWNAEEGAPRNFVSNREYRGINTFLLSCFGGSPYWLTFKQAKAKGGTIPKGTRGLPVIFWNWTEKEVTDQETGQIKKEKRPFLKYYTVFNLDQIEGIEAPKVEKEPCDFDPIKEAQAVIDNMPQRPKISHGGNRAYYRPSTDNLQIPDFEDFVGAEEYYNTAFHELAHATGHESRLNRKEIMENNFFGSREYSKEELVAEMTAAFLCGATGIENKTIKNSAAYIQGWSKAFRDNTKMVILAAANAQKAADFIQNKKHEDN